MKTETIKKDNDVVRTLPTYTTNDEYVRFMDADKEAVGNVFHQMRGRRTLAEFSIDSGYCGRMFTRIPSQEYLLPYVDPGVVHGAYLNRDVNSDVDEESLMAANGFIRTSLLDAMRGVKLIEGLNPDVQSVHEDTEAGSKGSGKKKRKKKKAVFVKSVGDVTNGKTYEEIYAQRTDEILSGKEKEEQEYALFLLDLSKFSLSLTDEECNALHRHTRALSKDGFFCAALHKYCSLVEYEEAEDMEQLRRFFNGERQDAPTWAWESKDYFDILYDLVFQFEEKGSR